MEVNKFYLDLKEFIVFPPVIYEIEINIEFSFGESKTFAVLLTPDIHQLNSFNREDKQIDMLMGMFDIRLVC